MTVAIIIAFTVGVAVGGVAIFVAEAHHRMILQLRRPPKLPESPEYPRLLLMAQKLELDSRTLH